MIRRRTQIRGLAATAILLAVGACSDGPAADPTLLSVVRTEAQTALLRDELDTAEALFDSLIGLDRSNAASYGGMGLVHLRRGDFETAERWIRDALERDPADPELRLMLAAVLASAGDEDGARSELERNRTESPDHLKSIWALAVLDEDAEDADGRARRIAALEALVDAAPANVAAHVELAGALIDDGRADPAAAALEALRQQLPATPPPVAAAYDSAMVFAQGGDADSVHPRYGRFREYFVASGPYQEAMDVLRGPEREMVGLPTFSFSYEFSLAVAEQEAVLAGIAYADAGVLSGLGEHPLNGTGGVLAMFDMDGDGDDDVLGASTAGASVHRVDLGFFSDESANSGLSNTDEVRRIAPADYDNDGWADVLFVGAEGLVLHRNRGDGTFEAGPELPGPGASGALWADLDHDGDLDVLVYGGGPARAFRNDGNGSFTEHATAWGLTPGSGSRDAAFGDLDDDGDLDVVTAGADGPPVFWSNERGGAFTAVDAGLGRATGESVAVLDIDADGALDLAFGSDRSVSVWINDGAGTFRRGSTIAVADARAALRQIDFDNDGRLDLVAGGPDGMALLRGDGTGELEDFTARFEAAEGVSSLGITDYNEDGDLDVLFTTPDGRFRLLRNDGAQLNHYVQISLEGLAAGSGKNNRDGIGARVEVTAGDLYQVHVATSSTIHVGMGHRRKADVIRIEWTNGVPQDIYYPGTDQELEEQMLKGSCPMLFTWDGDGFEFQKDVMWKSALGMPTGIQGNRGARSYAPAAASREYVRIPGEALRERDGRWEMRITEELWESIYFDEVELLVVDHPEDLDVYVDERFVPPHLPTEFRPYVTTNPFLPRTAVDDHGRDWMAAITERDHVYVAGLVPGPYQGTTEEHWLELDLGPEVGAADAPRLFLTGWVFPADASLNVAMAQAGFEQISPVLEVPDGRGGWIVADPDVSFPSGKDKTIVLELRGLLHEDDPRVRIRTTMQIYWDQVFADLGPAPGELSVHTLEPVEADVRYRGFSRTFRKGGRNGPHWFDYDSVTTNVRWRDLTGRYTRYGDVRELLTEADDRYVIMNAGDEVAIAFDATAAPPLPDGWKRDFVIYTVGWVKDGDLNTAAGSTVEPLPYHGMSAYPYGPGDAWPDTPEHEAFVRDFLTRSVEAEAFRNRPMNPPGPKRRP